MNFAAESHVDRSIMGAAVFAENVVATTVLLEAARTEKANGRNIRFLHMSTDEAGSFLEGSVDICVDV